ncbi:CHC2 zinc finger domain-containing protein [Desulfotomaculum copahuensis]|uniref:Zinc finger CHC2-type domain-containing protein n=1 Tax=Desulfotomaculum copahuensis TaxID=1838280 RepID=A0A1B7LF41_9FIRM|nr:CHC2 zinc finger domain-containing protein [Desulfotomaculum copahuensis]OAT82234.1 hypothetical protein A6M21_08680 [Desulfotomaculum copahuensis]
MQLSEFLSRLEGVKRSGNNYTALCPAHGDRQNSLSVTEKDGKILLKCFAGCSVTDIVSKLGLQMKDLFLSPGPVNCPTPANGGGITVEALAADKGLPVGFLGKLGVAQTGRVVKIPYLLEDGTPAPRQRLRTALKAKDGSRWAKGEGAPVPYGLWRLSDARDAGFVVLVEGESDAWTLWHHGLPALGLPGADMASKLRAAHFRDIGRVYVWREPDRGGDTFVDGVVKQFSGWRSWQGELREISLPGAKDPNELHQRDPDGFEEVFRKAMEAAAPLEVPVPEAGQQASTGRDFIPANAPMVIANNRFLEAIAGEAMRYLIASNEPPKLFNRGGEIVKITQIQEKDRFNQLFTRPVIKPVSEASLRGYLARSARFVKAREKNGEVVYSPAFPPLEVVRDIMALDDLPLPLLRGIVQAPVMRWDGSLCANPGYDEVTSLYYAPEQGFSLPDIPDKPTPGNVKESLSKLVDVVRDFPFDGEASQANVIAAIMTPVLRDLILGPVPMLLIDKPLQGTGASLLSDVLSIIATGGSSHITTAPEGREREEEWRKRATSMLAEGRPIVVIDNIEDVFKSATLCALLTSTNWTDRILGRNEQINLQHRTCWIATGNNVRLAGDLPRRCYKVRLDANMARPWQRKQDEFKHPHLVKYVNENRGSLLAAIYTIARAWIHAGRPEPVNAPPMGSFEDWRRVVGGILEFAGVTGFLQNSKEIYENAEVNEGLEDLVEALYQRLNGGLASTKQIQRLIEYESDLRDVLPDWLDPSERGFTRKLGRVLARKVDVIFSNGYRLERAGISHKTQQWKITTSSG